MTTVLFLYHAFRAYRASRKSGNAQYFGVTMHGVPDCCILIATGREAWRISQQAIESFKLGGSR